MRYRPLGQSGIEASVVGFGAWALGGWMWGGTDRNEPVRSIHAAIDAGITLIDTAPCYGFGLSEEIIGKAIADRRDKVVLATKCGLVWDGDKGEVFFKHEDKVVRRYLGADSVRRETEASLRRLGVDTIDLMQTHWQDSTTPIEETMGALMDLKQEGKIRAIGVSNATPEQMDEYGEVGPVDTDQERYSMIDREHEADVLPYCRENDIAFLAYSPMSMGLLTGKVDPEREFPEGDARRNMDRFKPENRRKVLAMLDESKPVADAHGLTFAQLAVAWAANQPGCTHPLCGARNEKQARENAVAGDVVFSEDELGQMGDILARCELPPFSF